MYENLKEICVKNINLLYDKYNAFENKNKLALVVSISTFILSKVLSLVKINIPGLSIMPICFIFIFFGLEVLNKYKETNKKTYLALSTLLLSIPGLIVGCLLITYPFIIASKVLL